MDESVQTVRWAEVESETGNDRTVDEEPNTWTSPRCWYELKPRQRARNGNGFEIRKKRTGERARTSTCWSTKAGQLVVSAKRSKRKGSPQKWSKSKSTRNQHLMWWKVTQKTFSWAKTMVRKKNEPKSVSERRMAFHGQGRGQLETRPWSRKRKNAL